MIKSDPGVTVLTQATVFGNSFTSNILLFSNDIIGIQYNMAANWFQYQIKLAGDFGYSFTHESGDELHNTYPYVENLAVAQNSFPADNQFLTKTPTSPPSPAKNLLQDNIESKFTGYIRVNMTIYDIIITAFKDNSGPLSKSYLTCTVCPCVTTSGKAMADLLLTRS